MRSRNGTLDDARSLILKAGIALALLRLQRQRLFLTNDTTSFSDLEGAILSRTDPAFHALDLSNGRSSPLESSSLGAALLRILQGAFSDEDLKILLDAVDFALKQSRTREFRGHQMGVDEVLQGRSGLLWSVLLIRRMNRDETHVSLGPLFQIVPHLVAVILNAGRQGAQEHVEKFGPEDAFPLMWSWIDNFHSLGAAHGITGILSVLLDPELQKIDSSILSAYPDIAETVTGLCMVCIKAAGDFPMSIPPYPSARASPLVQICHGTPGLLLLLASAKNNPHFKQYWSPAWDEAMQLGSAVVWKRGLLSKGGGLCHGIAGNALSLLLLYDPSDSKTDIIFSKGLAMLLEAQETLPFASSSAVTSGVQDDNAKRTYHLPDHPFSLQDGLAGTICAWAQACVLIQTKLRNE
jgi:hypothetical protein